MRVLALAEYQVANGAGGLLFACSAFSDAIKAAGRALEVPVLRPDEAAIEQALSLGEPVRVLCTFAPTLRVVGRLVAEFRDDPAQPVAFELVEQVEDCQLGAVEAVGRDILGQHTAGSVECDEQIDAAALCFPPFVTPLRSGQRQQDKKGAAENKGDFEFLSQGTV